MSAGPRVALTFDAEHPDRPLCPPGNAERILDALADARARATFFVQGRWALSQPAAARRIADDGHLVGHHSHFHARMPLLSPEGLAADVAEAAEAIERTTGVDPRPWFRFPFGAGGDDPVTCDRVRALGYTPVGWHVALEDWEPWRTADDLVAGALDGVREHGDGTVVLLHTWPGPTGEAVPRMLATLGGLGARFVTVDELDDLP